MQFRQGQPTIQKNGAERKKPDERGAGIQVDYLPCQLGYCSRNTANASAHFFWISYSYPNGAGQTWPGLYLFFKKSVTFISK